MKIKYLHALLCIFCFYFAQSQARDESSRPPFQSVSRHIHLFSGSRLELGYTTGKFIGAERSYAEAGVFIPAMIAEKYLAFGDVRAYRLDNCKWAASGGVGLRTSVEDKGAIGANLFYDYLESRYEYGFNRIGIGAEWLGTCFDVRLNGYLPFGQRTRSLLSVYSNFIGNYLITITDKESCAKEGFDAEFGMNLGHWQNCKLYGAVGPYFYQMRHRKNFWGGQVRLEFTWKSCLSIQIRTSYDSKYHTHTQGRLMLNIPLDTFCGCNTLNDFYSRLITQPVKRNGLQFTRRSYSFTTNY
ncbi:MAG: inverse autotransporter beta domain-containing protein [Parachlamydiaceae bacterium]